MNAAVVHSFHAPPRYTTFADPVPAEDEVLVTVSAAGLHRVVKSLANGSHYGSAGMLPLIPGIDGVGRLEDGTRVYFGTSRIPFGSFAERTVTTRSVCLPICDALDDVTVAAMTNPGMSSWAALTERPVCCGGECPYPGSHGHCRAACCTGCKAPGCQTSGCSRPQPGGSGRT
jgi:NADPH2:quinone reductase